MTPDGAKLVHPDSDRDQSEREVAWARRRQELCQAHAEREVALLTPSGSKFVGAKLTNPALLQWVSGLVGGTVSHPSVLIWGVVGVGKTYNAYATALELIRRQFHIGISSARSYRRESVVRLLAGLRPGGGLETLDEIISVPVLLLDDLGAEKASDWTLERLYELVNERYEANAVTIVSTNHKPSDLARPSIVGPRVASRLAEMCLEIPIVGPDRRQPKVSR